MTTKQRYEPSRYRIMWCLALFDLPTGTADERNRAAKFRKVLLHEGFVMLQLSVYAQPFSDAGHCEKIVRIIRAEIPPKGEVRLLYVTDSQFGKMETFFGRKTKKPEKPTQQLLLF